MSKKFFIIGLTALLGVSLFLTGCPTDADDYSGNWYDGLVSPALTGIVLVKKDLTVPAGETLAVSGGTLKVASGVTLTVNGVLTVSAPGTFAGTDGTSRLVVPANAAVTGVSGVTAGKTYLWNAGWFDGTKVKEGVDELTAALGGAGN
jgi:hypothetical protein